MIMKCKKKIIYEAIQYNRKNTNELKEFIGDDDAIETDWDMVTIYVRHGMDYEPISLSENDYVVKPPNGDLAVYSEKGFKEIFELTD